MDRRSLLKGILSGVALVPAAAVAAKLPTVSDAGDLSGTNWQKDGVKFSEWTFPQTRPSVFRRKGDTGLLNAYGSPKTGARLRVARKIQIPVFNREKDVDVPFEEIVDRTIEDFMKGGASVDTMFEGEGEPHVTIVRVKGRPDLVGIGVTRWPIEPVVNHYESL